MDAFDHLVMCIAITTLTLRGVATILGADALKGPLDRLLIFCVLGAAMAPLVSGLVSALVHESRAGLPEVPAFGPTLEDVARRPAVVALGVLVAFGHVALVVAIVTLRRRVARQGRATPPIVRGRERAEREERES